MGYKFLILNTDYVEFLRWLYANHPRLELQPYEEQMQARAESLFGVADFYSSNLRTLGHEAYDIYVNNECMQKAWARERGIRIEEPIAAEAHSDAVLQRVRRMAAQTPLRYLKPLFRPVLRSRATRRGWFYDILAMQIKQHKPDVVLNQAMDGIESRFLKEMKPYIRLLVGQIASPLPMTVDLGCYDLVVSSLPNFVERFQQMGVRAHLHRLAFEPRLLKRLKNGKRTIAVSFVGSLSPHHGDRIKLLEYLCNHVNMEIWGHGDEFLAQDSVARARLKGTAWGIEMYQILHNSKMTVNNHIDVAESYANNYRLYEATGVGSLLLTDWKVNLHEIFEPGKEVVVYRTPDECAELIRYYLKHDDEREAIARAGQQRTLHDHNYSRCMQDFECMVSKYL